MRKSSYTVALRGQLDCNLRKHQQYEKHCKNTQNTTEIGKMKTEIGKNTFPKAQGKCLWGENNQLQEPKYAKKCAGRHLKEMDVYQFCEERKDER